MRFKKIIIFIFIIFILSSSYGENYLKNQKDYTKSISEILFINVGLSSINNHVGKREWAEITFDSVMSNFESGFTWDNDGFPCNMIDHPYHGAQYYSVSRSSGLNIYESALLTAAGSLQWEYFMETNSPSLNDFMVTSTGGVIMGEYLHRLSLYFMTKESKGMNEYLYNFISFVASPFSFINNKLLNKRSYKINGNRDDNNWEFYIDTGFTMVNSSLDVYRLYNLSFNSHYNDISKKNKRSFDIINSKLTLLKHDDKIYKRIDINSSILANDNSNISLWTSYKYNELIKNYKWSGIGIGPGIDYEQEILKFDSNVYFIIGAASARYALVYGDEYYTNKNETYQFGSEIINGAYYLGSGIMSDSNLVLSYKNFQVSFGINQFWVNSFHATDANEHRFFYPVVLKYERDDYYFRLKKQFVRFLSFYDAYKPMNENFNSISLIMGVRL